MKKHISYIDFLRILACFLVIVNHSHGLVLNKGSENALFYTITYPLCKIAVPIFLMITGILVLDKEYDYKKVLKSIFKIFVPLVIISFLVYAKNIGLKNINLLDFTKGFIKEPYVIAFWYLYLLMGLYIVIPFIQKLIKNFDKKDYKYFLLFFLFIPSIISLLSAYFKFNLNEYFMLPFFGMAVSLLVAGNYLNKLENKKTFLIIAIIVFIVSYIGMFLSMYLPFINGGQISYKLDSWNSLPVILMAMSFLYIAKYTIKKESPKLIVTVSSTCFGIYLIHMIFNHRIYDLAIFQEIFKFSRVLGVLTLEITIFIICFIIVYILKKIPLIKKFL